VAERLVPLATALALLASGCRKSTCEGELEAVPFHENTDAGALALGVDTVVVRGGCSAFLTEDIDHQVSLGPFIATYTQHLYKGQTNQSVLDVSLRDVSCSTALSL
jgi:hypothetical protein